MSAISQQLQAVDKQRDALRLRLAGSSYDEIAKALGYRSASGAFQAVKSAMRKTLREPADELRMVEVDRLDQALRAIWPAVKSGSLQAIDRFLKISERRSRLVGLDAKTQINLSGEVTTVNIDDVRAKRWEQISDQLKEMGVAYPKNGV